jgi:3-oxoacyl-[acyl-carrier-protein] synthase II
MSSRVVITGIGVLTAAGQGSGILWNAVLEGRSFARRISRFDPSAYQSQIAAEIDGFEPRDWMDARSAHRLDLFAQFGVAVARQAACDAGLPTSSSDSARTGVSLGSALGGVPCAERQHASFLEAGIRSVAPNLAISVYGGAGGANVAIQLGMRGPNIANASSCASGAIAVGDAFRLIQRGDADVMLAGGVEAPLAPLTFGAFSLIKAMSARNDEPGNASRPFDKDRDGFVMGEGACLLVLEERQRAITRGVRIYAEILGYAQTNDAYHMTAPRPDGADAARAIVLALADAGTDPQEIEYVNAHATGTPLGDAAESRAVGRALGAHGELVPVSGTRGVYGHPLGASGAIEVAISALALFHGVLPGTTNLHSQDPACPVNVIAPQPRESLIARALTTSFGFGGVNAALVLGAG